MRWVSLFALGKANGFTYFKAYLDVSNHVVGWINRGQYGPDYYNVYTIDSQGRIVVTHRGTWQHADLAVTRAVASSPPKLGIGLDAFALRT